MPDAPVEPVISVRDVVVSYGGRRVLNGINHQTDDVAKVGVGGAGRIRRS